MNFTEYDHKQGTSIVFRVTFYGQLKISRSKYCRKCITTLPNLHKINHVFVKTDLYFSDFNYK